MAGRPRLWATVKVRDTFLHMIFLRITCTSKLNCWYIYQKVDNECTSILFTFGSEIFCPDLTELPDVVVASALRHVGSKVHMHCASAGLRFIDGKMNKSVTCLESGDWSEIVSNCSGEPPPSCAFTQNT